MKEIITTLILLIVSLFILGFMHKAHASDGIQFEWDIPTERVDGSTLLVNEISGYTLYEDGYEIAFIPNGTTTSYTYQYDGYGRPCFSISTTDSWGQEGGKSEEECVNVFPAPPKAPVRLNTM